MSCYAKPASSRAAAGKRLHQTQFLFQHDAGKDMDAGLPVPQAALSGVSISAPIILGHRHIQAQRVGQTDQRIQVPLHRRDRVGHQAAQIGHGFRHALDRDNETIAT